jgi:hypothetical protein
MSSREHELQRLARRINWLARFRRPIAIALAAAASLALMYHFTGWVPKSWPGGHMVFIIVMVGTVCWYAIESVLGFVLALWETDYASLTRRPSLPHARLLRRK